MSKINFKAREEEKQINKIVSESLRDMSDSQKDNLKANLISRMPLSDAEIKKVLAEIELRAFVFERVLDSHKEQCPNLYNEYQMQKRGGC